MAEKVVQDLTLTIPEDGDQADMPLMFANFSDGMPQATQTEEGISADKEVTPADINKIFEFDSGGSVDDEMTEHNLTVKELEDDDLPYFENGYGFQFAVATKNNLVTIQPESGVEIQPINTVPKNSLAIITRVSNTLWIIAGGSNFTTTDFIFDKSLMAGGDQFA